MPSVGMRRSTRVFGARVLRSGRRLWTGPYEFLKGSHGENKFPELLENGGGDADNCHKATWRKDKKGASIDMTAEPRIEELAAMEVRNVNRMCDIVYRRKRKRAELTITGLTDDERYGKKFVRKKWRKCRASESFEASRDFPAFVRGRQQLAIVLDRSTYDYGYWIACFLTSVVSYITRGKIGMRRLSSFLRSKPLFDAYSSHGIVFLQDPISAKNRGFFVISGSRSSMPLFSVDISTLPSFFTYMQTSICFKSARWDCLLVSHYEKEEKVADVADDTEEHFLQICSWRDASYADVATSEYDISEKRQLSNPPLGLPKSALRNLQLRNSRNIQKRRSYLRRKRGRPASSFQAQKASGAQFSASAPTCLLRSSNKRPTTNIKELKSAQATQNVSSGSCSANLLVTETDKCHRVEGATVTLQLCPSNQWVLVVTKGGLRHRTLTAQKAMRPPCSNRFNHSVIWIYDDGWKLEFPDKQDWLVFKELYTECSDRNMQSPAASVIPVPGVQEVSGPVEAQCILFVRPDSYITTKDDELTRALGNKTANYDMDSEDEDWLVKFNSEEEIVTHDRFELVIDALEKGFHCNRDEYLEAACDFCMHLERREVVEDIHKYWIGKRKRKRSALIRVFQLYRPRRSQVIPKFVPRKKRSFKRQTMRGKQQLLLQAEEDASEQQNNTHKLNEAKADSGRYEEWAMLKRQRAQMLMENADLATYRAMMALRIAEAARIAKSPDTVASFFLE